MHQNNLACENLINRCDKFSNLYFLIVKNYPNLIIKNASPNTKRFLNEDIINKPLKDFVHPDDRATLLKEISSEYEGSLIIRLLNEKNIYRWVFLHFNKIQLEEEISTIYIYFIDINELYNSLLIKENIINNLPIGIVIKESGKILYANKTAEHILGYSFKDLQNLNTVLNIVYPEDRPKAENYLHEIRNKKLRYLRFRVRVFTKNKKVRWIDVSYSGTEVLDKFLQIYLLEDITQVVKLEDLKNLLSYINKIIISFKHKEEILQKVCFKLRNVHSLKDIWIGKVVNGIIEPFNGCKTKVVNIKLLDKKAPEYRVLKEKDIVYIRNVEECRLDENWKKELLRNNIYSLISLPVFEGNEVKYIITLYFYEANPFTKEDLEIFREISNDLSFAIEKYEKEKELFFKEFFDPLTGLGNKNHLLKDLEELIKKDKGFILALVDIYNFRYINENFGIEFADKLLKTFANKLDISLKDEFVYRYGSDEFAIISFEKNPIELINNLLDFVKNEDFLGLKELPINIAVIRYPEDGNDINELLIKLERTLEKAKQKGVNSFVIYDEKLYETLKEEKKIELLLNKALAQDLFEIHLQPIFSREIKVSSAEVLLRLRDENGNYISPALFIPIAEKTGIIEKIDSYVLSKVKDILKRWKKKYTKLIPLSINATPNHLKQLCNFIVTQQEKEKLHFNPEDISQLKGYLTLELTERNSLELMQAKSQIHELKKMGFRISLDDFGTGYSSLSYLSQIEVDYIKIDKIFIQDFLENDKSYKIVEAILNISKIFNLNVVAEGVETKEQLETLKNMGCEFFQGFYLEKPIKFEDFEEKYLKGEN